MTKMRYKIYPVEKIADVAKVLASIPATTPTRLSKDEALKELGTQIRELHFNKHYETNQILDILKEHGVKANLKDIRDIIRNNSEPMRKYKKKNASQENIVLNDELKTI